MKPPLCGRESDLWTAIASGAWPEAVDADLRRHVSECASCRELEIVAVSLSADGAAVRHEGTPPSSAIVWWRAQMRARQEAAKAADRPISIVQSLAIACAAGLVLGLVGTVAAWVRGSAGFLSGWTFSSADVAARLGAVDLTSQWILVPAVLIAATLVIMPIAVYVIVSDD